MTRLAIGFREQNLLFFRILGVDCFNSIVRFVVSLPGHILSLFVDFLPQRQTQFFLNVLAQRMAHDKASTEVRAAVVRALTRICGAQHITHVIMKGVSSRVIKRLVVGLFVVAYDVDLLPELANLIHDDSEKVRLSMVELLDTVKQIKSMRYRIE